MTAIALGLALVATAATSQGRSRMALSGFSLPMLLAMAAHELGAPAAAATTASAVSLATIVAWAGLIPSPWPVTVANGVVTGVATTGVVLLAGVAADAAPVAGVAVLATGMTVLEVAGARSNPFGEWGALAHTQARQRWALHVARCGPAAVTLVLVTVGGGMGTWLVTRDAASLVASASLAAAVTTSTWRAGRRTASPEQNSVMVEVVGLVEHGTNLHADLIPRFLAGPPMDETEWATFRAIATASCTSLLERTREHARHGADLVVWAEGAGVLDRDQHAWAQAQLVATASEAAVTVVATWALLDRESGMLENRAVVALPDGTIGHDQHKGHPVPGLEADHTIAGSTTITAVPTPVGRLAVAICFDADHPDTWRAIRASGADIVALPSSDWPAIADLHAGMARMRARSADVAIIRPARFGTSMITDQHGARLATVDHRSDSSRALRAHLSIPMSTTNRETAVAHARLRPRTRQRSHTCT